MNDDPGRRAPDLAGAGEPSAKRIIVDGTRVAMAALRANWARTLLAILGVGVGAGVVVTVAAIITGIRTEVLNTFEASGPDNFTVMPFDFSDARIAFDGSGRPPWWDRPEISDREIRRMQSLPAVAELNAFFEFGASIRFESDWVSNLSWRGVSSTWTISQPGDFVSGRNFTPTEVNQARAVMVISNDVAKAVFGEIDPVGRRVRVNAGRRAANELFTVVGVYEPLDNVFGEVSENFAVVPFTAADKRLKARDRWTFMMVDIVPREEVGSQEAENQIIAALRSMRELGPGEDNDFAIVRAEQIVEIFNQLTGMFFIVIVGLSSVGMLVGGIGVIGIMLISVTERTREIGIRKAIGATRQEIKWQFLIESSMLTAAGAVTGLLVGWGASETLAAISPLPARIPIWSVAAAVVLAILTGILFGMLPALRASRLDPVEALRFE